ncbi:MAG: hypothetical protein KAH95_12870, partial [Spirochaetales bacterium]|nr:hypothetical protein [Spirochaetales bacterium]
MNKLEMLKNKKPYLWINPGKLSSEKALSKQVLALKDIRDAEDRLQRFAPLLIKLFPELEAS